MRRVPARLDRQRCAKAEPASMTRILLAILEFYRRWLSPAVHSLGGRGGCRFCRRARSTQPSPSPRTVRCADRRWRSGVCCAATPSAAAGSIRYRRPDQADQAHGSSAATNHYHRKSGVPSWRAALLTTGSNPLPEIRNPNLESQGGPAAAAAAAATSAASFVFTFLALAGLMAYQYFKKPKQRYPAERKLSKRSNPRQQASTGRTRRHPPAPADRVRQPRRLSAAASAVVAADGDHHESRTRSTGSSSRIRARRSSTGF